MNTMKQNAATRSETPTRKDASHRGQDHIAVSCLNQSQTRNTPTHAAGGNVTPELFHREEYKAQELSLIEQVVMQGDLSKLNPEQRVLYYKKVCESAGLNPFTRPFDYIILNGKLTLYAKKDATEQLRKLNGISIEKLESQIMDDLYIVKATARTKDGRTDEATGAVTIGHLKGDAKANAIMKAETKAKRRVTLSISGMGWTDETELESIPNAKHVEVDLNNGEMKLDNVKEVVSKISQQQANELEMILGDCDEKYRNWFYEYFQKAHKSKNLCDLPSNMYQRAKESATKKMEEHRASQRVPSEQVEEQELIAVGE